ncbi:MAG TPA: hypothetical protein PK794_12050, partial [Armatimonadota bacterium]|nr:hypothetical protein [Armatimonadota bacterium]
GRANADAVRALGDRYEARLRAFAAQSAEIIERIDGTRHLCTLCFHDLHVATRFAARLVERGFDTSAQTYKATCPPAVMLKLPIIVGPEAIDCVITRLQEAMAAVAVAA